MKQTFWLTRWALTRGIIKADGCEVSKGNYATRDAGKWMSPDYVFCKIGVDAWPTQAEALAKALTMVEKKLKAVDKERNKLLNLEAVWRKP